MIVRKTIPTLSAVALDSSTLSNGTDTVIGRVKVTVGAGGALDWGQMVFTINKADGVLLGATTTDIKLYEGATQITGTFATTSSPVGSGYEAFLAATTNGKLYFRPTAIRTVPENSSATYELRANVSGIGTGDNISVSIANPATAVTTGSFTTVGGTFGSDTSSFVWSDLSVNTHVPGTTGGSEADWTDDYLVQTLPLTIGNKSVSF